MAVHLDLARRRHYRDFYRPQTASRQTALPLWLVWGNCQAEALRLVLETVPGRPFRTMRIPPVHELESADLPYLDAVLAQTAVLVTQPVRPGYRELPLGVDDLLAHLPAGATVLRWPVIRYAGLYPFQVITRRPADRSITPPTVPYHDLRTVAALHKTRGPGDAWDVEVTAEQIRAVAAASRDELAQRERRDTDVGVSDLLVAHGADAAHTINHPGNAVLDGLARRVLDAAGVAQRPIRIVEPLLDSTWAPLEQRVIDALELAVAPRLCWRHHGVELDPQQVHATQLDWYAENLDFIELTVRRHRATMDALGLLGGVA